MKLETVFGISLVAGFLFSMLFVLSSGKLRIHHGAWMHRLHGMRFPHVKISGKRVAAFHRDAGSPFAGPVLLGMFLTLFGFLGLVSRTLLELSPEVSTAAALAGSFGASTILGSLFNRYFAVTATEVKGSPLPGMMGRVSLAVPESGVGLVAYRMEGKRFTMPARGRSGQGFPKGTRVMVIDVQNHIALIDEV